MQTLQATSLSLIDSPFKMKMEQNILLTWPCEDEKNIRNNLDVHDYQL